MTNRNFRSGAGRPTDGGPRTGGDASARVRFFREGRPPAAAPGRERRRLPTQIRLPRRETSAARSAAAVVALVAVLAWVGKAVLEI